MSLKEVNNLCLIHFITCPLVTEIGTAFTTNSANGVLKVCLSASSKLSIQTRMTLRCCKVHQSACSSRENEAIGSSRGGKNTKIHVLINEKMQVINVVLSGGQINDSARALSSIVTRRSFAFPTRLISK